MKNRFLKIFVSLVCFGLVPLENFGQDEGSERTLHIKRSKAAIRLDGIIDEEAWQQADSAINFHQQFPFDSSYAKAKTVVRATYDDEFIYFAAICYSDNPGKFVVPSLRRDFRGQGLDLFAIILDTFQDLTNAFTFGTNPVGVQREGLVAAGGADFDRAVDFSWDNKWYNAVKIHHNAWVAEFAIPFKTIRFKAGAREWNINFFRQDSQTNERAPWARVPRIFPVFALNYHGKLIWDEPLKHPGPNISVIPYAAQRTSKDFSTSTDTDSKFTFGGDAKIAVSSSLNLDVTVNPDFSNVEVDQQQTNLNRFELFFPERRQFFLENQDLFADYGNQLVRPFFSRRIGLAQDTSTGLYVQNKILFGARLSGNVTKKWRVGLLNMQGAKDDNINLPSYNFGVATAQRRVGTNSNVRAIVVNKQDFGNAQNYDRTAGLDYNYSFNNNKYTGNIFFHQQFKPGTKGKDLSSEQFGHGLGFNYNTPKFFINWKHQIIGKNYKPSAGFVPRAGYKQINPVVGYVWYPKSKIINNHGPGIFAVATWDDVYKFSDSETTLFYQLNFQSGAQLIMGLKETYTKLTFSYDPSESKGLELIEGSEYRYKNFWWEFESNQRRKFTYRFRGSVGEYYNGNLYAIGGSLSYRLQPYGVFSVDYDINKVTLPKPFNSADILLIGPRVDLTLTRSLFWTTTVQYNSQFDNLNINSRLQWRFKPVSDLFIVYTDNYFYDYRTTTENFTPKNRAIVLKLTYWLNL